MAEKYFKSLNYSLANEDTWPEVHLLKELKPKKILSVAGSGGRCLPLVSCLPSELTVIDLSEQQLWLVSLREETIRNFSHEDFLLFWGYPPYTNAAYHKKRKELFGSLELSADATRYFENLFKAVGWSSILYEGKWEKTFNKFSYLSRLLLGEKLLMESLSCLTTENQKEFFKKEIPRRRWDALFRILGNATVFNALLYKGHFVKKNVPDSHIDYYKSAFRRIFERTLLRENFFAQLCFFGKIVTKEAIPVEGDKKVFESMKLWLNQNTTKPFLGNILEIIPREDSIQDIDFFSFSDVPSYFEGETERNFLQVVKPKMVIGGLIIVRSYLRFPENPDLAGYEDVTSEILPYFEREKVQMYIVRAYRRTA